MRALWILPLVFGLVYLAIGTMEWVASDAILTAHDDVVLGLLMLMIASVNAAILHRP